MPKVIEAKIPAIMRSRSGVTGIRLAASCISTTASRGIEAIFESEIHEPVNLGSNELVTINQLVDIVEEIAAVKVKRKYNLTAPRGVKGRNSDNTKLKSYLGWEPSICLKDGMSMTYDWIESEMMALAAR